jgi:hypothetical protein
LQRARRTLTTGAFAPLGLGRPLLRLLVAVLFLVRRRASLVVVVVVRADLVVLALRQLLVGLNQLLGVLVNLGLDESGAAPLDLVLE